MEEQLKLEEVFKLSLQIPGSTFYHQPNAGIAHVYLIKDGAELWSYRGWYGVSSPDNLDNLIETLKKHISEQ